MLSRNICSTWWHTVYPKKYAHGFVVLCFVVVMQSFIMNSHEVFIHIHQGCFAGTGAIVRLPQCQWSKPDGCGKISQCITTTKHSKAKTVCIFLGIYCIFSQVKIFESQKEVLFRQNVTKLSNQKHQPNMIAFYLDNTFFYDPKIFAWEKMCGIMWNKCFSVTYSLAVKFGLGFPISPHKKTKKTTNFGSKKNKNFKKWPKLVAIKRRPTLVLYLIV